MISDLTKERAVTLLRFFYPLWAVIGMFSIMFVPSKLIVWGDAALTAKNILANELLFRLGIMGSLITQLIFLVVVLILYRLFRSVDSSQALLMVVFALVSVPISMLNTLNRIAALSLSAISPERMMFFLRMNVEGMFIATIFWGLWLFPLGYLVYKSGYFPKVMGIIVILAGFGYILDSFIHIVLPDFSGYAAPVVSILTIGEVLFMLWVMIMGAKLPSTKKS